MNISFKSEADSEYQYSRTSSIWTMGEQLSGQQKQYKNKKTCCERKTELHSSEKSF